MLQSMGTGLGMLGLAGVFGEAQVASGTDMEGPLSPKPSHRPPRARRIIHIFLNGGPSQVDTFDPKPALARYAGQTLPGAI